MMAEKILKLLRLGRKKESDKLCSENIETQSNQSDNEMTVEKFGSFSNLKARSRDKQSLVVHLLRSKHEKLSRKKSASECCLETEGRGHCGQAEGVAPLCTGESNLSISSLPPASARDSSLSLKGTSRDLNKSIMRETQSCELLSSDGRRVPKNKNLEFDSARKTVSAARIKDDTNIMRNIKKREVINALKGNGKSSSLGGLPILNSSKKQLELRANFALSDVYEPKFKDSKFVTELLDWHNLLRARHGVKGLELDTSLCRKAQTWANYLAHTNEFHYQNPKEQGENLLLWPLPILPPSSLAKKVPDVTGRYVATYWYRSHSSFPYHADPDVMQSYASAFTQMVWAASQTFGCGKARSSNGKVIVVAYYYPKGNIPDKYHLNVVQPRETLEH